jgi:hypothetical protein
LPYMETSGLRILTGMCRDIVMPLSGDIEG